MAHFAQLDEDDVVLRVVVVANEDTSKDGVEDEATGIAFCQSLFGADTLWAQTSYNGRIRVHYAGIGYTFDRYRDAFIPPQPYPSWTLDYADCEWIAPVPYPEDGGSYVWSEDAHAWIPA